MKLHAAKWLIGALVVAAGVLAISATAAAEGTTQVDGIQTLVSLGDPNDPADDVSLMDGYGGGAPALLGLWYTRTFVLGVLTPSGVLTATGAEEFVGCLDVNGNRTCDASDPDGTLSFTSGSPASSIRRRSPRCTGAAITRWSAERETSREPRACSASKTTRSQGARTTAGT